MWNKLSPQLQTENTEILYNIQEKKHSVPNKNQIQNDKYQVLVKKWISVLLIGSCLVDDIFVLSLVDQ